MSPDPVPEGPRPKGIRILAGPVEGADSVTVSLKWDSENAVACECVSQAIADLLRRLIPEEKRVDFARDIYRAFRKGAK